jgi:putative transposase
MPKGQGRRHSEDEVLRVLKEVEGGAAIAAVARAHGVTEQTVYRWRDKYGGMQASELKQLRALQTENERLRRIVARQALEIDAYKVVAEGKW